MVSYNFSDISPYDDSLPVKLLEEAFAERYCESKKVTKKIWDTVLNKSFPGTPDASCQGLFNQIHKKGARSTVWLLTPRLIDYIFPFSRSLQRYA